MAQLQVCIMRHFCENSQCDHRLPHYPDHVFNHCRHNRCNFANYFDPDQSIVIHLNPNIQPCVEASDIIPDKDWTIDEIKQYFSPKVRIDALEVYLKLREMGGNVEFEEPDELIDDEQEDW